MKISIIVICKGERKLALTLEALASHIEVGDIRDHHDVEVIVVDASAGRLQDIADAHADVRWIDYTPPPGVRVSIPQQRNVGLRAARGEIVVFTDAGCVPAEGWLSRLIAPLVSGAEQVTCGPSWVGKNVYSRERGTPDPEYVNEAATINLALTRAIIDSVGDFDERFEYGSDMDFTWRVVSSGARIRYVADALVVHDWGTFKRQLKRSVVYGKARVRLYRKHRERLKTILRDDPVLVLYPIYLVGLPVALRYRSYLLLPLIPLWRARKRPYPVRVVVCHLAEGVGCLKELAGAASRQ
jgi:glycosyltransferase involved in cell wall biosynthesis